MAEERKKWTRYSDEDRAVALAALQANGGDVNHTAKQLGIPRMTLVSWVKGHGTPPPDELRQEKKLCLADELERLALLLVGDLTKSDERTSAAFKDKAVAMGIAIDKMQLLRGQPTAISESQQKPPQDMTTDELRTRVADALRNGTATGVHGEG